MLGRSDLFYELKIQICIFIMDVLYFVHICFERVYKYHPGYNGNILVNVGSTYSSGRKRRHKNSFGEKVITRQSRRENIHKKPMHIMSYLFWPWATYVRAS